MLIFVNFYVRKKKRVVKVAEKVLRQAGLDEIPVEEPLETLPVLVGDGDADLTVYNSVALYDPDRFQVHYVRPVHPHEPVFREPGLKRLQCGEREYRLLLSVEEDLDIILQSLNVMYL